MNARGTYLALAFVFTCLASLVPAQSPATPAPSPAKKPVTAPAAPAAPTTPKPAASAPKPPGAAPAAPATPAAPAEGEEPVELDAPRNMSVTTADGVAIKFTYYKSPAEEAVPIILLHGGGGKRDDFKALAEYLQSQMHAVVVPDLRGHGESISRVNPVNKQATTLNWKTQNVGDLAAMVTQDMDVIWNFLIKENNAKTVNIKKLCVVGVDMGAIIATGFVVKNYNELDVKNQERGKDVKALVLVSPPTAYRGLSYAEPLKAPAFKNNISTLVLVGKQEPKDLGAAKTLYGRLSTLATKKTDVRIGEVDTKLQRTDLLSNAKLAMPKIIDAYLTKALEGKKETGWSQQVQP